MKRSAPWRQRQFGTQTRSQEHTPRRVAKPAAPTPVATSDNDPGPMPAPYPTERQPLQGFDYSFGAVG